MMILLGALRAFETDVPRQRLMSYVNAVTWPERFNDWILDGAPNASLYTGTRLAAL